ncbi:MAG TPA: glycosyltransferase family 4 protein [Oculatellaceae cyanobacterium]
MKLLILASHPVPYHASVFRKISQQLAQAGHECLVVYLSDFSLQEYFERSFSVSFAWDEPLLDGYRSEILNKNVNSQPLSFFDLKAPGWQQLLDSEKPTRLLVVTLNYVGAVSATVQARLQGIPATLRCETNDVAFVRSNYKTIGRSLVYKSLYTLFDSAIAYGTLNRQHLLSHGFHPRQLGLSYFCVPDRFQSLGLEEKQRLRATLRRQMGFSDQQTVILFCGKLISKKNPELLIEAVTKIPETERHRLGLLYVGSGFLAEKLQSMVANLSELKVHFAGFKNQQELPPYYLAADLMVLPSRRQGEVWGLVVNEALQAGLPCIVTDAVGCAVDFADFPDFQVIPENDPISLAEVITKVMDRPREFERYHPLMKEFSEERSAQKITDFLLSLSR